MNNSSTDSSEHRLRRHVINLLQGRGAHLDFEGAIGGLPAEFRGAKPAGIPHTPWRLLEHLRICQWDILEYSRDPRHVSPEFPVGYWPDSDGPSSDQQWDESVERFRADLGEMIALVQDPASDLLAPLPHGQNGHTLLREALLVADHNAYHIGQLVMVRRALGAWPEAD